MGSKSVDKNLKSSAETIDEFEDLNGQSFNSFNQNIEFISKLGENHDFGASIKSSIKNLKRNRIISSETIFLNEFYNFVEQDSYGINSRVETEDQEVQIIIKDYWRAFNFIHFNTSAFYTSNKSRYRNMDLQLLDNGDLQSFNSVLGDNFNNLEFNLQDYGIALGSKFQWKKLLFDFNVSLHNYQFILNQTNKSVRDLNFIEPVMKTTYKINKDSDLELKYRYQNRFGAPRTYLENSIFNSFNSIYNGNPNLLNESIQTLNLDYSNYSNERLFLDAGTYISIRDPQFSNAIRQNGIVTVSNIIYQPDQLQEIGVFIDLGFNDKKIDIDTSVNIDFTKYSQIINEEIFDIGTLDTEFDLNVKSRHFKNLNLIAGFKFKYGIVQEDITNSYNSQIINFDVDFKISNELSLSQKIDFTSILDFSNRRTNFWNGNFKISYAPKESALVYSLNAANIFNNSSVIENRFSSNILTTSTTFILPSIYMFTVALNY